MNTTAGRKSEIQKGENAAGIRPPCAPCASEVTATS
jgi:hypothetical protein